MALSLSPSLSLSLSLLALYPSLLHQTSRKAKALPSHAQALAVASPFRRLDWLEVRERSRTKTPSSDAPLQARHIFWRFVRHSYPIKPQAVLLSRQALSGEGGSRVSMEL